MLEENNLESDSEVKVRVSLFQLEDGGYQIGVVSKFLSGLEKDQAEKKSQKKPPRILPIP